MIVDWWRGHSANRRITLTLELEFRSMEDFSILENGVVYILSTA